MSVRWADHAAYMRSVEWKAKRAEYQRHRKWECRMCGTKRGIQLHHLSYANWRNEPLEDLMALCQGCHELVHAHREAHPEMTLGEATHDAVRTHRTTVEIAKRKRAIRKAKRKADRPQTDWVERLGAKTIRIKPSTESRHGTSG